MTVFSSLSSALVLCVALNFILAIEIEAKRRPLEPVELSLHKLLCMGGCGSWELQGPNSKFSEQKMTFTKVRSHENERMKECTSGVWAGAWYFPCKFVDKEAVRYACDHKITLKSNSEKSGPLSIFGPWRLRVPDSDAIGQNIITFRKESWNPSDELPVCESTLNRLTFPCRMFEAPSDELCSLAHED